MKIFNISNLTVKDLDGNEAVLDASKPLGNEIYREASTIEDADFARKIHKGEAFEINTGELEGLKRFILTAECRLRMIIKEGLLDYIENLKNEENGSPITEN